MVGTTGEHFEQTALSRLWRGGAAIVAAVAAGCALPGGEGEPELVPSTEPTLSEAWAAAIRDTGEFPVMPPTEDLYVGDVYVLSTPPDGKALSGEDIFSVGAVGRWKTLPMLTQLETEYGDRPSWNRTGESPATGGDADDSLYRADPVPDRQRIVGLTATANMSIAAADLEPFIPLELAPLIEGPATPERVGVSLQASSAETYSLSVNTLLEQLVDTSGDGSASRLKPEHLRTLPLVANTSDGHAYLSVISEVLYVGRIEATIRKRYQASPGPEPGAAAIRKAAEMNAVLPRSVAEEPTGDSVEFTLVTDDALTVRRTWAHPVAVAVRGVTLDVDTSTGQVLRMAPLGIELPTFGSDEEEEREVDESEVLEERRRGAEATVPEPEYIGKTRWYWDFGPRYDALGGDLNLFVGGRLHLDAAAFSDNDEINTAFGDPDPGLKVRRAFLELGGVYKQFDFNFWLNFSDSSLSNEGLNDVNFRNVFVGMNGVPGVGAVRAGYFKEPFGLEETTSSNDTTFMERSLTDAFIERRNLGVMAQRRFTENRRMTAALGLYRSANNDLETGTGYGVTGRVTGAPILDDDGRRVLHLGLSATYRDPGSDGLQFSQTPESAQAQVMADTGTFAADQDVRVGAEFGTVFGSLSFQSEAIVAASEGGAGAGDPTFWSTYLMGSYVLTGEHRNYRPRVGAFGSVDPGEPFWKQGRGAVELAGRYSYLDLDSASISGGKLHDWTLGLNWYANRNMRVMFNYIAAHPEGFGFEHILQARLQLTL